MASPISKTERAKILILAFMVSLVGLTDLLVIWIHDYLHPETSGIYVFVNASLFPFGHLLSVAVFPAILFAKRYLLSSAYILLCLVPFVYEFTRAYRFIYHDPDLRQNTSLIQLIYLVGNPLDFLLPPLLTALVFWQVSFIFRQHVKI